MIASHPIGGHSEEAHCSSNLPNVTQHHGQALTALATAEGIPRVLRSETRAAIRRDLKTVAVLHGPAPLSGAA